LRTGTGVAKDTEGALKWYKAVAKTDGPEAMRAKKALSEIEQQK
jgi:TPR repeat protein